MKRIYAYMNAFGAVVLLAMPASGAVLYNNLTPNNQIAVATRPENGTDFEIEAADDFVLGSRSIVNSASFIGLGVPGAQGGNFSVTNVVVEMYRVFSLDSDTNRTPQVPTRLNSPSDVAFDSRDGSGGELSFTTSLLGSLTTLNSVQPGPLTVNPPANPTSAGNGPLTGQEMRFDVTFTTPFDLPADHYFFVPQVTLSNGAQFYWLSASRPISGAGTTPISPDLQEWTRNAALDPDWLRVGTDIVAGIPAPTFNAAFSLEGTATPEPGTIFLGIAGMLAIGVSKYLRRA